MDRQKLLEASVVCARFLRARISTVALPGQRPKQFLPPLAAFRSAPGLLRAGEEKVLRTALDSFLNSGPMRNLIERARGFSILDPNILAVQSACAYALKTGNHAWAGLVMPRLETALETSPALKSKRFSSRFEAWKALDRLAELSAVMGRASSANRWKSTARAFARAIDSEFWNETFSFYADSKVLEPESNLAAAAAGLCSHEAASKIIRAIDRAGLWSELGPLCRMPLGKPAIRLSASAFALTTLHALGRESMLERTANAVALALIRDQTVPAAYEQSTGLPRKSVLAQGAALRIRNAGLLLETFGGLLDEKKLPNVLEEA